MPTHTSRDAIKVGCESPLTAFYGGVVSALYVVRAHGHDTVAREIVESVGRAPLVAWCRVDLDYEMADYILTVQ